MDTDKGLTDCDGAETMKSDDPQWSVRVQTLLRLGYGVEDIALRLGCDVKYVRAEVQILREQGRLPGVLA